MRLEHMIWCFTPNNIQAWQRDTCALPRFSYLASLWLASLLYESLWLMWLRHHYTWLVWTLSDSILISHGPMTAVYCTISTKCSRHTSQPAVNWTLGTCVTGHRPKFRPKHPQNHNSGQPAGKITIFGQIYQQWTPVPVNILGHRSHPVNTWSK